MIFEYDISYMNGLKLPETPFDQNDTGLEMETIEILKKTYDDFEKRHGEHVSYFIVNPESFPIKPRVSTSKHLT